MSDIQHYQEAIKTHNNYLKYLSRRVSGINGALNTATNKAVVEALNNELSEVLQDIKDTKRDLKFAEDSLERIKRQ